MTEKPTFFQQAVDVVEGTNFSSPVDRANLLIGLADIEAKRILADSNRLLAEAIGEQNRLERIRQDLEGSARQEV